MRNNYFYKLFLWRNAELNVLPQLLSVNDKNSQAF